MYKDLTISFMNNMSNVDTALLPLAIKRYVDAKSERFRAAASAISEYVGNINIDSGVLDDPTNLLRKYGLYDSPIFSYQGKLYDLKDVLRSTGVAILADDSTSIDYGTVNAVDGYGSVPVSCSDIITGLSVEIQTADVVSSALDSLSTDFSNVNDAANDFINRCNLKFKEPSIEANSIMKYLYEVIGNSSSMYVKLQTIMDAIGITQLSNYSGGNVLVTTPPPLDDITGGSIIDILVGDALAKLLNIDWSTFSGLVRGIGTLFKSIISSITRTIETIGAGIKNYWRDTYSDPPSWKYNDHWDDYTVDGIGACLRISTPPSGAGNIITEFNDFCSDELRKDSLLCFNMFGSRMYGWLDSVNRPNFSVRFVPISLTSAVNYLQSHDSTTFSCDELFNVIVAENTYPSFSEDNDGAFLVNGYMMARKLWAFIYYLVVYVWPMDSESDAKSASYLAANYLFRSVGDGASMPDGVTQSSFIIPNVVGDFFNVDWNNSTLLNVYGSIDSYGHANGKFLGGYNNATVGVSIQSSDLISTDRSKGIAAFIVQMISMFKGLMEDDQFVPYARLSEFFIGKYAIRTDTEIAEAAKTSMRNASLALIGVAIAVTSVVAVSKIRKAATLASIKQLNCVDDLKLAVASGNATDINFAYKQLKKASKRVNLLSAFASGFAATSSTLTADALSGVSSYAVSNLAPSLSSISGVVTDNNTEINSSISRVIADATSDIQDHTDQSIDLILDKIG